MPKTTAAKSPRKTAKRRSTKRTAAKKPAAAKIANDSLNDASAYAKSALHNAQKFASSKTPADALKNWTSLFQQTPFKMEMPSMNAQSFPQFPDFSQFQQQFQSLPQFGQFQTKSQDAANQYSTFLNKATAAAEKSRNRLAAGAEECGKTLASMAQSNAQRANEAMRTLMACKSLNEYADVQNRLFKQNFEAMSSETAKLVEQVTKTLSSASEPLNDLASSAMTDAKKAMAA